MHRKFFLFTVDVEDWFQVENLRVACPQDKWDNFEFRLEKNVSRLLELFESFDIRATFFVLGWVANKVPQLIRRIHSMGHEIASHGYWHNMCSDLDYKQIVKEIKDSKRLLEDTIGDKIFGFRAPNFSINRTLVEQLAKEGYTYDSSYNTFKLNPRYGNLDVRAKRDINGVLELEAGLYEIPIFNLHIKRIVLPLGGGAYFRLLPVYFFIKGIEYILKQNRWYLFYMHPWEIDPGQPRIRSISLNHRVRHYLNLSRTFPRLKNVCQYFSDRKDVDFISCIDFLKSQSV